MNYLAVRQNIKTGDILSCCGTAWYSKLIQRFTGSEITHTGIAIWVKFPQDILPDRLCILEAHLLKGVQLQLLSNALTSDYWKNGGKVYWQSLCDPSISGDAVASFALNNWSKDYMKLRHFAIAGFYRYMDWSPRIADDRVHCSQLVTKALKQAGFTYEKNPSITTPGDVSRFDCLSSKISLDPCTELKSGDMSNKSIWCDARHSSVWRPRI